ncbi:AbrB/MazE/SpoVT family DNA-binding domain-containing protein [Burkholderia sp. L27(2015)]|jgi:antitoxin MazE|uniref:AbrB/MazE/SpoVT family DNA-binding domain-containing protein n=1 Tax=Burkholderia sp. L27(2015) TaxID=1641858 RepID=UPI00131CA5D5|nr:AbrB/MazE/SpoVT family DNA-binding domain-containing protein [Burkholderia sp. L27(2015)]
MKVVVKKWGNSAALRLPASLMDAVSLQIDQAVELRAERGHIVLEPLREREYDLDSMLAAITPANQHASVDFGAPVGKETF